MRRSFLAVLLLLGLVVVGPAQAAYESASGGEATPSALAVDGGTDYSVSITGKPAVVDLVLVLDNSGSMADSFGGGGSRWNTLAQASESFVGELETDGFFARGGKVGVVLFSTTATTATAPTANVATIDSAIASGSPDAESCISCGLQRASELLAAVPGSTTHKRIAYIVADGANTVTPPSVGEAVTAAAAAGVERRVIGIGAGAMDQGLESLASSGTVAYPENAGQLTTAYAAQSTHLPGATDLAWSFHLTPGFTASAPAASIGTVAAGGGEVTWTIPSLAEQTATLTFHASHDPGAGCAAISLLSGTTFSDTEGDAAPAVALGPVSIGGCAGPAGGTTTPAAGGSPPQPIRATPATPTCKVPNLKGKKLVVARKSSLEGGCRLGKVTKKKGVTARSGKVVKQSPKAGTMGAAGTKIKVVLGG
jgi:von Willebrand factor type A domain/PASTA domain